MINFFYQIRKIKFSKIITLFFFVLIFFKFFYLNNEQVLSKSYADQIFNKKIQNQENITEKTRQWGPIFYSSYKLLNENEHKVIVYKIIEFVSLILIIFLIFFIYKKIHINKNSSKHFKIYYLLIILLSSSFYYSFLYGSGAIFLSFLGLLQFYLFLNKKYFFSCLVIFFGIYYKMIIIVIFGPILFLSLIVKEERKLFFYFFIISIILLLSYFIFKISSIEYPFIIIYKLFFSNSNYFFSPISYELFDLRTLIIKLLYYQKIIFFDKEQINFNLINKTLIITFAMICFSLIFILALKVSKLINKSSSQKNRTYYLVIFYILTGFIILLFFFEESVEASLMCHLSIISPLILLCSKNIKKNIGPLLLYLIGLLFYGNLIPISIMSEIGLFNYYKLIILYPDELVNWKAYIFSHSPYLGILFIFLSYVNLLKREIYLKLDNSRVK